MHPKRKLLLYSVYFILFCYVSGHADDAANKDILWAIGVDNPQLWKMEETESQIRVAEVLKVDGVRFCLDKRNSGMKWKFRPAKPIKVALNSYIMILYRAENFPTWGDCCIAFQNGKERVLSVALATIIDDGDWHRMVLRADHEFAFDSIYTNVQAAKDRAYVEIKEINCSNSKFVASVWDEIKFDQKRTDINDFNVVEYKANSTLSKWCSKWGYQMPHERGLISVYGIPFDIRPELLVSDFNKPDQFQIDLNQNAENLFLLMSAKFDGPESSSIGWGKRNKTIQPAHIVVRVFYSDGTKDDFFPTRMPAGVFCVGEGMGVYRIGPLRNVPVKSAVLEDNCRNASFALAAVTAGLKTFKSESMLAERKAPIKAKAFKAGKNDTVVNTSKIQMRYDAKTGTVGQIVNKATGTKWLGDATRLYELSSAKGIRPELRVEQQSNGEVGLKLTLTNVSNDKITTQVEFPVLRNVCPNGEISEVEYCFPGRCPIIGKGPIYTSKIPNSGYFPLQFMSAGYKGSESLYLRTNDKSNEPRSYWLRKSETELEMGVSQGSVALGKGESVELVGAVIGINKGDWRGSLAAYKEWLKSWYKPVAGRKQWWREVFSFREQFLHFGWPDKTGAFDPCSRTVNLTAMVEHDIEQFGGIDYLHLFDWTWTPEHGRVGDYQVWDYLGGAEKFREEVSKVKAMGIPVGLYFEGYLASPKSRVGVEHGKEWQLLKEDGSLYTKYGDKYHMCPSAKNWREHLAAAVARCQKDVEANGCYLDQLGFAKDYICWAQGHEHGRGSNPVKSEQVLLKQVRSELPEDVVLYSEETPTDVSSQYQDGSFSVSLRVSRQAESEFPINLTRFAIPDFKIFEIMVVDKPVYDDIEGVRLIFFNGQGIWLMGSAEKWYSPEVKKEIVKAHKLFRKYKSAFTSNAPEPLVETNDRQILANYFPAGDVSVWTLFNKGFSTWRGEIFAVKHTPGAKYYDAWRGRPLKVRTEGNRDIIQIEIGPRDAACIVVEKVINAKEEPND